MPAMIELAMSRATLTGRSPSATLIYLVAGTKDEREVRLLVLNNVPATYEGVLFLQSTQQNPQGGGVWQCIASYGINSVPAPGEFGGNPGGGGGGDGGGTQPGDAIGPNIKVSITGVTQHVTRSLRTTAKAKRKKEPRNIPDHGRAVGVNGRDGSITGADIIVPSFVWTETWTAMAQVVTWKYLDTLDELTGRVNEHYPLKHGAQRSLGYFRTRPPGEVMFLGAEIDQEGLDKFKIAYTFKRGRNMPRFKLIEKGDDEFEEVFVTGHQHVWVQYSDDTSGPADKPDGLRKRPDFLYVEDVGKDVESKKVKDGSGNEVELDPTNGANFERLMIGW